MRSRTAMTAARWWALLLILGLGGCANATGYQSAGADGGYSELQLAPDMFRVAFQGNIYTSQERVADMALLRAAELTLARGAHYFLVINHLRQSRNFPSVPHAPLPYASYAYWGHGTPIQQAQDHRAEIAIRLLHEEPRPDVAAYSARLLREELQRKYALAPK
jgi:hypothetical protein